MNMLKVYLVDDEPWIVSLLENLIPWKEHGFKIIGKAFDGEQAIREIRYLNPDIVITDIRMPEMTGLELISQARELPEIPRFVILSGHSEFKYAQQALREGVFDYLLKPVEEEALLKVLERLKREIREQRVLKKQLSEEKGRLAALTRVLENERSGSSQGETEQLPERDRIKRAIQIMEEEYGRDLSLSDMAGQVYLSDSYFSDLFSRETGRTFKDYLTDIRMERAKHFLQKPGLKIKDVAAMTGFSNPNYFCKVFRKKTGMSPKEYIRSL